MIERRGRYWSKVKIEFYLTHFMQQPCGWVKVAEYACESGEQRDKIERDIRACWPSDTVRFEYREV